MDKIRNLSVRKTIILYMVISLFASFVLSVMIMQTASHMQRRIWEKYADYRSYYGIVISRPNASDMRTADHVISEVCDFLQTYTILIVSLAGSCGAVLLFYRNKLQTPLMELERSTRKIAGNDLDFHIVYENQDEMGRLCREFERMRDQLAQNNQQLWRMVEDERALRAAITHDIRSPLSVLKGYQEMLMDYLPDGTISIETAVGMLDESRKQILRMDYFVDTMRKMNSLEQRKLMPDPVTAKRLEADIQAELAILAADHDKRVVLHVSETTAYFRGDREMILEVMENLLSNAFRYAKDRIEIKVSVTYEELSICVTDDGNGFGENTEHITDAFYQENVKDSLKHSGLGMYISRVYCEKHGGTLLLGNSETGGAVVTAVFHRIA